MNSLLNCFEWQTLRFRILIRDQIKCQKCGLSDYKNHIHHKIYIKNLLPWEISNDNLETLCRDCHKKTHKNEKIKVFEEYDGKLIETFYSNFFCPRCLGTNYLPHFKHVENGVCFLCNGNSVEKTIFEKRLREIKFVKNYSNKIFDEFFEFIESISLGEYTKITYNKNYQNIVTEMFRRKSSRTTSKTLISSNSNSSNPYKNNENDLPF